MAPLSPSSDRSTARIIPMTTGEVLLNLLLNVVATVIGIVLIYVTCAPRIRLGCSIKTRIDEKTGERRYNCSFKNRGPLTVVNLQITVWIRIPSEHDGLHRWQLLEVPVDDRELPVLRRSTGTSRQMPRLLLDKVNWELLPTPVDLRELLMRLNARLHLHVTATGSFGQIVKVARTSYGADDVQVPNENFPHPSDG